MSTDNEQSRRGFIKIITAGAGAAAISAGIGTTVAEAATKAGSASKSSGGKIMAGRLREIFIAAGADDVGFVEASRESLGVSREIGTTQMPSVKSFVSIVVAINRANLRTTTRNLFVFGQDMAHHAIDDVQQNALRELRREGIQGLVMPMAFPMNFPHQSDPSLKAQQKVWGVEHRIVAEQAGMGLRGHSRNVLHPKFGVAILLGTCLLDCEIDHYDSPKEKGECIECKQCVEACPSGAIHEDGSFDWLPCLVHNYRYAVYNFLDWIDALVTSGSIAEYRKKFDDGESITWWQSMSSSIMYQCGHCQTVCPAGSEALGEFMSDPEKYHERVVRPMVDLPEYVYALPGSATEKRTLANPAKTLRLVKGVGLGIGG
jgi:epoxyqueuosine reductase QueG